MASKPIDVSKSGKSMLHFLPAGPVREGCEIILSGLPGAVILSLFILGTALLNIFTSSPSSGWFAATYVPVICLLPLVVGIIAPLLLERVRRVDVLSLRRSVVASAISGLLGSLFGALLLIISDLAIANAKPFASLTPAGSAGLPIILVLVLVLVFVSTVLSAIGGAILVLFLSRAMTPKSEG